MNPNDQNMQTITSTKLENKLISARKAGLASFSDIEHRLELVRVHNDVEWVNDSKATDIDSTGYSLDQMQNSVIWLVGEPESDSDYELLAECVHGKVRAMVLFGSYDGKALDRLVQLVDDFKVVPDVDTAVEWAARWANAGETVLFSPASSSFSSFENYKQRGDVFRNAVNRL